ncbi:MAG: acyl-CoA reductase [Bacteroidetes bacterium]|nr:acyl-CoA reductase [Bacteroidota bacterium]
MFASEVLRAFRLSLPNENNAEAWNHTIEKAYVMNKWFEPENIRQSLGQWNEALSDKNAEEWLSAYKWNKPKSPLKIGIIMAGNIPLVGIHDAICALVAGHHIQVKFSSEDETLPKFWLEQAAIYMPDLKNRMVFSENMKEINAAIATGSNNSARYFEYYFRNIPSLLRKNRNSVAVLSGNETPEQLRDLGHDVFDYFGLGCRNITHLLLPENYAFKPLFDAWEEFYFLINHNKYVNNFHYHRALLLMNLDPHMDNGFVLLKERQDLYSPVGMLNYSFYKNSDEIEAYLKENEEGIQCVVSGIPEIKGLEFGQTQKTQLGDYADNMDTLKWLIGLESTAKQ